MVVLLLAALVVAPSQGTLLVGLWDSVGTSVGGIGGTLEFRADGTFVEATTVIVDLHYRISGDRLLVGERPPGPGDTAAQSARFQLEGDVLQVTQPDGSVVRKERLGRAELGKPAIVGAWRYRHYTGADAFERYTEDGRMLFRLPMRASLGRYVLTGNDLVLTRPGQADVAMTISLKGDDLAVSTSGRTTNYRRDSAGPWYGREQVAK